MPNPFKPSAGSPPPLLVGRQEVLSDFREAIEDGPGSPGLLQFVTGARGVGKTVMLTKMGDLARNEGWSVVEETATEGLIGRLTRAVRLEVEYAGVRRKSRTKAIKTGIPRIVEVTKEFDSDSPDPLDLRLEIERLLNAPIMADYGLLISIDEIHTVAMGDLEQLAAVIQHLIRDGRPVALLMAGIPQAVDQLVSDNAQRPRVSTFLRRAERTVLGSVDIDDVEAAFVETGTDEGRQWADGVSRLCAEATQGYPFMIQLVGYHVWRAGCDEQITADEARAGIEVARRKIGNLVHAPALQDLSDVDRTILVAMAQDDGPSRPADIADRIGKKTNYVAVYRKRLESAGMVRVGQDGWWSFSTPELRKYLRDHAAHLALTD